MSKTLIIEAPNIDKHYRVYFDIDSGEIQTITNEELTDKDLSSIEVSYEDVEALISGEEPFSVCKVEFDTLLKTYVLKRNSIEDPIYDVNGYIFKVKNDEDADIKVIQDLPNTCWKFFISEKLRETIVDKQVSLKTTLSFSITEENNPNILYRTLKFPFSQLVNDFYIIKDFKEQYEFDGKPISVYTIKRFDTYSFEVINE